MNGVVEFVWTDRAKPIVEVGIGDSRIDTPEVARWSLSDWDDPSSTWAGTEPLWDAITGNVHSILLELGRKRATDAFEPARLSLTVSNEDGWGDPEIDHDPEEITLRAGRAIRVGVDHVEFGIVWKFRGYIDTIVPRYDAEFADVVDIGAVCALGEAGRATVGELAVAVGAGELAGSRMHRILNAHKWPANLRAIVQTGVPMLATTLGRPSADLMSVTVDSSGGAVYGDTLGRVKFVGKDWQTYDTGDDVDGVIGNLSSITTPGAFRWPTPRQQGNYVSVPLATPAAPNIIYRVECVRPPNPGAGVSYTVTGRPYSLTFTNAGIVATIRMSTGADLSTPVVAYSTLEDAGFPAVGETIQLMGTYPFFGLFVLGWRAPGLDLADLDGWNGASSVASALNGTNTVPTWTLGATTVGATDTWTGDVHRYLLDTTGPQLDINADTDLAPLTQVDADTWTFTATTGQTVTVEANPDPFVPVLGGDLYTLDDASILVAVAGKPDLYVEA